MDNNDFYKRNENGDNNGDEAVEIKNESENVNQDDFTTIEIEDIQVEPLNDSNFDNDVIKPQEQYSNNTFYKETIKTKEKKSLGFGKVVVISIISSLVGGTIFGFVTTGVGKNRGNLSPNISYYTNQLAATDEEKSNADNGTRALLNSEQIAERVGPAIVGIVSNIKTTNPFFGTTVQLGSGSGIILNKEGYIVTNHHVVEGAADNKVQVILSNGQTYEANIVGTDFRTDLAVIKIEPKEDLHYATLGDSSDLKAGETAIAIGNPLGQEFAGSVTRGVISAVNRSVQVEDKQLKLIQTDAAINPGNSGGALVNSYGEVIGINTVKITQSGVEGLGFAIPINEAKPIIEDLIKEGYVKGRPVIGISGRSVTEDISKIYGYPVGVMVIEVQPFSGAELGGLKPKDIIQKVNGKEIKTVDEINTIRDEHKAGDELTMDIVRDTEKMTLKIKLGEDKPQRQSE